MQAAAIMAASRVNEFMRFLASDRASKAEPLTIFNDIPAFAIQTCHFSSNKPAAFRVGVSRSSKQRPAMNAPRKSGTERFIKSRLPEKSAPDRAKEDERRETLILVAIAILLVANVVLYLCHHYGLTSLNDWKPRSEVSARVIVD
jgi:hypothetical protein